ncbi:MAG: hypothetical protein H6R18_1162 [Proteobacteria bacterium]|nr:hypothetical protein [Pseudomonadota bacterium]
MTNNKFPVALSRPALWLALGLSLTGCSNCNLLSNNSSIGCQALWAGALVAASPALLVKAGERGANEETQKQNYLALKAKIEQGDLAAAEECVLQCGDYLVFRDEKHALRRQAAQRYIQSDSAQLAEAKRLPMMLAYDVLSGEKDGQGRWQINRHHTERGWALVETLPDDAKLYGTGKGAIEHLADNLYKMRLDALPAEKAEQALKYCVSGNLLPRHATLDHRSYQCKRAYQDYQKRHSGEKGDAPVPKELELGWKMQSWEEDFRRREAKWLAAKDSNHAAVGAGVARGERWALEVCVLKCPAFYGRHELQFYLRSSFEPLRQQAALKLIALDRPGVTPDQAPAMIKAYSLTLLSKDKNRTWPLQTQRIRRGLELAGKENDKAAYSEDFLPYHFLGSIESLTPAARDQSFENCVSGRWLASQPTSRNWSSICMSAYEIHALRHGLPEPRWHDALPSRWEQDWKVIETEKSAASR